MLSRYDIDTAISGALGYVTHLVMHDGGALCLDCYDSERELLDAEYNDAAQAGYTIRDQGQWLVQGIGANYECTDMYCDHCNKQIAPLYCE